MPSAAISAASRSRWPCHGASGHGRPSSSRQRLAHRDAPVAERGQGSAGAAELQVQRFVETAGDARPPAPHRPQPPGRLQSEGDRRSRLQQRAPQHHGVGMLVRESPQPADHTLVIGLQHRAALAQQQHQRRVRHVLAGRAPMNEAGRLRVARPYPLGRACEPAESPVCRRAATAAPVPPCRILPRSRRVRDGCGRGCRNHPAIALPPSPVPLRSRASPAAHSHRRRPATALRSPPGSQSIA